MPPNSKDRELYMEMECRMTSSPYPQSNKKALVAKEKKSKQDFNTKETKLRKK